MSDEPLKPLDPEELAGPSGWIHFERRVRGDVLAKFPILKERLGGRAADADFMRAAMPGGGAGASPAAAHEWTAAFNFWLGGQRVYVSRDETTLRWKEEGKLGMAPEEVQIPDRLPCVYLRWGGLAGELGPHGAVEGAYVSRGRNALHVLAVGRYGCIFWRLSLGEREETVSEGGLYERMVPPKTRGFFKLIVVTLHRLPRCIVEEMPSPRQAHLSNLPHARKLRGERQRARAAEQAFALSDVPFMLITDEED